MIHWVLCTRREKKMSDYHLVTCDACGHKYDPEAAVVIGRTVDGEVTSLCTRCAHVMKSMRRRESDAKNQGV